MSEHRWNWTTRAEIASRAGAHIPHMQEILKQLAEQGWDNSRDLFGIEMALEESLTNAIRHGNRFDLAKKVNMECKISPDRFWLRVRDEGPGFTPAKVPDCTDEENLGCLGGRGLALIEAFMTHVEHNECGNCVTMEKIRTTANNNGPPKP
jgi:serine/threonine-protein kinase RsbW